MEDENKKLSIIIEKTNEENNILISADIQKLRTILWHLVDNAIKFTEEGTVKLGYQILEGHIKFHVSDTGIGMAEDKKEKIFEQFKRFDEGLTRKFRGIGLGLALCKGFVNLLGGEIWFDSIQNQGSIFYFTIPYKPLAK